MEKRCLGCGEILQNEDENAQGYVVNMEMDYCKRCFRMIHYDSHKEKDFIPDNGEIIRQLAHLEGDYVWIIDIYDLETSLCSELVEFYKTHSCHVILNKCDLLPASFNSERLKNYILKRIRKLGINSRAIITRGADSNFKEIFDEYIYKDRPVIFTGVANVGKSTIINELLQGNVLTTNRYPATTIRINEIRNEEYHFFDTAGLWIDYSCQVHLKPKDLKVVVPDKKISSKVFQIKESQSLSLSGLARIDIVTNLNTTAVINCSPLIEIHRGKQEKADEYWKKHYGQSLSPVLADSAYPADFKRVSFTHKGKADYFICGLGFVTITSSNCRIDVYVNRKIRVIKREAMI